MQLLGKALNLRIQCGETDKYESQPLYEAIVYAARKEGMAGATVFRGIMSFGASHSIHTIKIFSLGGDLPILIDITDSEEQVQKFIPVVEEMMEKSGKGGLITTQEVEVHRYLPGKKHRKES
jgi:uncharacterized protein